MTRKFTKPFTQQEPLPEAAIERAVEIMRTGRLHRYNVVDGEEAEASVLEREFAAWQGSRYCLACSSGGAAIQIALRAAGVKPGDRVLANAYTLAPVPGAMFAVGAEPVLIEIDNDWHTDLGDLAAKAAASGARFLLLSHMRGHIADMDAITTLCERFGLTMIEDCAHTMGARWKGIRSGNHGRVACFSAQTYKHVNAGEGGLLSTDDAELAARAIVHSGSYMLYGRHGAAPDEEAFRRVRLDSANLSSRMDNLRAAILRPQLATIGDNIVRWNTRYQILEQCLRKASGLRVPERHQHEAYVGSSIQFQAEALSADVLPAFVAACGERGVEIKWFGDDEPRAFTSRYDSWRYLGDLPDLPRTRAVLSKTCDLRIPLTFSEDDCRDIAAIIGEVMAGFA